MLGLADLPSPQETTAAAEVSPHRSTKRTARPGVPSAALASPSLSVLWPLRFGRRDERRRL
eukprot:3467109-Alexandrium_andersonii.AAC.1